MVLEDFKGLITLSIPSQGGYEILIRFLPDSDSSVRYSLFLVYGGLISGVLILLDHRSPLQTIVRHCGGFLRLAGEGCPTKFVFRSRDMTVELGSVLMVNLLPDLNIETEYPLGEKR